LETSDESEWTTAHFPWSITIIPAWVKSKGAWLSRAAITSLKKPNPLLRIKSPSCIFAISVGEILRELNLFFTSLFSSKASR